MKHFEHINTDLSDNSGEGRTVHRGPGARERLIRDMRHWFFSRKKNHGFLLQGFPADTFEATLLDEWLDCRDESLSGCLWLDMSRDEALSQARRRVACRDHGQVAYVEAGETHQCELCGATMSDDSEQAVAEVDTWFAERAAVAEQTAAYYRERGQLFRFDASRTSFEEVAGVAAAVTVDR
ncbi:MAG: hypothetical protein D6781_08240 [Verrucomicrobia bacterium]|nr:MAG: hypothetical protein D6781_08240 [Verrucomicrobiota bacterium]